MVVWDPISKVPGTTFAGFWEPFSDFSVRLERQKVDFRLIFAQLPAPISLNFQSTIYVFHAEIYTFFAHRYSCIHLFDLRLDWRQAGGRPEAAIVKPTSVCLERATEGRRRW